ncbi:hypothetical protein SAMN05660909_02860 [Chitinophaga terrae (ex Kim and Jung 2007)]|uniref:Leucine-rich repeat domain-containing protein n=1 Tax=Chitinophaga terrae (ex Kim and Jung 2007) TaxID=408074 RepID=A0A1H4CZX9_9BACT|nr:hypothetical protein [Chitinophaga terrae (ex Kim and Jung 2007)]SEA65850.1 hypothetical protein SAMN05660909_02860 [Chitinophaga terrae (ex Kim and Jung 2007)]
MESTFPKIKNHLQDRNSLAWTKLCAYIDIVIKEEREIFSPAEGIGQECYQQIYTLPESIGLMKNVKHVDLYGSMLTSIPPEIGQMEALETFNSYTSDNLHWYPYEITNCTRLRSSKVSTRVLYTHLKGKRGFPDLKDNPVRYHGETVKCSICQKEMTYGHTNQRWISLWVGNNVLPLLTNLCSTQCQALLPQPPEGYVQFPHKGGPRSNYIRK